MEGKLPPACPSMSRFSSSPGPVAILRNGSIIHGRKGADLRGKESEAKALRRIQRLNDQRRSGFLLGVLFFRLKVKSKGIKGIDQLPIGPKEGALGGGEFLLLLPRTGSVATTPEPARAPKSMPYCLARACCTCRRHALDLVNDLGGIPPGTRHGRQKEKPPEAMRSEER